MAEVFVIDRITTAPGRAQEFIDTYLAGYAPGARDRGMTLRDILVSPPIWFSDRPNTVTITWSLPSAQAWWQMTWRGRPDPSVARFWSDTAHLVSTRSREVATRFVDVDSGGSTANHHVQRSSSETTSVTRLIDVAECERSRVLTALRATARFSGAVASVVEPTLPGSRNGGDILVHLRFASDDQWRRSQFDDILSDPAITRVNGVTYRGTPIRSGGGTVYRALLLRVPPEVDSDTIAAFEAELAMLPSYVPTITAWQLSRVGESVGPTAWTHVFEQEFTDADGLMGPYLMHPIHWAVVDRWFDPETTDVIIRDRVCHSFCQLSAPVII